MFYVYRNNASTSARDLAQALQGRRFKHEENLYRKLRPGDVVVCWGSTLNDFAASFGVRFLNNVPLRSKYADAETLRAAQVPTVEVSRTRPQAQVETVTIPAAPDPAIAAWTALYEVTSSFPDGSEGIRTRVATDTLLELMDAAAAAAQAIRIPAPQPTVEQRTIQPVGEWIGRLNNHVGGNDLLTPPATPDYYTKKEDIVHEYRVHSFNGKSIRAGIKTLRDGWSLTPTDGSQVAHPWIRSWEGGWRISYDGNSVRQRHRDLAHQAVAALGLSFGAVDIAERADGSLFVLEVNRAPGLEGGTITAYSNAIQNWATAAAA